MAGIDDPDTRRNEASGNAGLVAAAELVRTDPDADVGRIIEQPVVAAALAATGADAEAFAAWLEHIRPYMKPTNLRIGDEGRAGLGPTRDWLHLALFDESDGRFTRGRASFQHADLFAIGMAGCSIERADFLEARLTAVDLSRAWAVGAAFNLAWLIDSRFDEATLQRADLLGASVLRCSFRGADLAKAQGFREVVDSAFDGADLRNALLSGTFTGCTFEGADLSGATLTDVRFEGCSLRGANLLGAKLEGTSLDGADLTGATLPDGLTHD
jgi:hypothetical protein